jgi:hypothetical protein
MRNPLSDGKVSRLSEQDHHYSGNIRPFTIGKRSRSSEENLVPLALSSQDLIDVVDKISKYLSLAAFTFSLGNLSRDDVFPLQPENCSSSVIEPNKV